MADESIPWDELKAQLGSVEDAEEAPPQLDHPQLRETGNGPTVSYEEPLLEEFYGKPGPGGVYFGREG